MLPLWLAQPLALTYRLDARNQIRLPASRVFVCLVQGLRHHPQLTKRLLEASYTAQTRQHADHSRLGKRLETIAPAYFATIYTGLHQKMAPDIRRGAAQTLRIRGRDATTVTLSAKLLPLDLSNQTTHPNKRPCPDKSTSTAKSASC